MFNKGRMGTKSCISFAISKENVNFADAKPQNHNYEKSLVMGAFALFRRRLALCNSNAGGCLDVQAV